VASGPVNDRPIVVPSAGALATASGADRAARLRPVLGDHRLAERSRRLIADQAGEHVDRRARRRRSGSSAGGFDGRPAREATRGRQRQPRPAPARQQPGAALQGRCRAAPGGATERRPDIGSPQAASRRAAGTPSAPSARAGGSRPSSHHPPTAGPDHLVRHFLAAMRRQAVHEQRAGIRRGHHPVVDAPAGEGLPALSFSARSPCWSRRRWSPGRPRAAPAAESKTARWSPAGRTSGRGRSPVASETLRRKPSSCAACSQGVATLLASPIHATVPAGDRAALLDEGEDVGQDLAGVVLVGQSLITGTRSYCGEALDPRLLEGADHHRCRPCARSPARCPRSAPTAELRVAGGDVDHRAAELVHAGLEAHRVRVLAFSKTPSPACGRRAAGRTRSA